MAAPGRGARRVSRRRSLAVEYPPGAGHRSRMEHRGRSPGAQDRSQRAAGIFLRPQQRDVPVTRFDQSAAPDAFPFAGVSAAARERRTGSHRRRDPVRVDRNLDNDEEATEYLRLRTYLLSYRGRKPISLPTKMRSALPRKPQEPIASQVPSRFVVND